MKGVSQIPGWKPQDCTPNRLNNSFETKLNSKENEISLRTLLRIISICVTVVNSRVKGEKDLRLEF